MNTPEYAIRFQFTASLVCVMGSFEKATKFKLLPKIIEAIIFITCFFKKGGKQFFKMKLYGIYLRSCSEKCLLFGSHISF